MSTEVVFEDESALTDALASVRDDNSDVTYIICGHINGSPNLLGVLYTGNDTKEIGSKMDPSEAMYGLARYEIKFDLSFIVKFVYIHWMGEDVALGKKGLFGVVHRNIESKFSPYHLLVEASTPEDLDPEKISYMLMETAGITSKVIETEQFLPSQMRGFTQTQLPYRERKPNFEVLPVSTESPEIDIFPDVFEAVSRVRSDADSATWMVAGYMDANPDGPVQCVGFGEGGLDDLKSCFEDLTPMYGLLRMAYSDDGDITMVKFVYIIWVGTNVKPVTKAKISTHKGMAENIFGPAHVTIYASEICDIVEEDIMRKVKQQAAQ